MSAPPRPFAASAPLNVLLVEDGAMRSDDLRALLSAAEFKALQTRTRQLLRGGHLPEPHPGRNFPWPPL